VKLSSLLTQHIFFVNPLPSTASPYGSAIITAAQPRLSLFTAAQQPICSSLSITSYPGKKVLYFLCAKIGFQKQRLNFHPMERKKKLE
jgi:hypothetical protein